MSGNLRPRVSGPVRVVVTHLDHGWGHQSTYRGRRDRVHGGPNTPPRDRDTHPPTRRRRQRVGTPGRSGGTTRMTHERTGRSRRVPRHIGPQSLPSPEDHPKPTRLGTWDRAHTPGPRDTGPCGHEGRPRRTATTSRRTIPPCHHSVHGPPSIRWNPIQTHVPLRRPEGSPRLGSDVPSVPGKPTTTLFHLKEPTELSRGKGSGTSKWVKSRNCLFTPNLRKRPDTPDVSSHGSPTSTSGPSPVLSSPTPLTTPVADTEDRGGSLGVDDTTA